MTNLTPHSIVIGGHRIAYGIEGTGAPVILLHGTPAFSHIWRNVAPPLVAAGHRVFVYDLLGFGRSERPADPSVDTSVTAQVPVLLDLMEAWSLDRAHIVAHDIGGAIAQRLAVFHPERIISLTLIDNVSFDSWPSPRTRQQIAAGLDALISAPDAEHRAHTRSWLESAITNPDRLSDGTIDAYLEMISGPVGQSSLYQHQIAHYDPKHTMEVVPHFHKLADMPVQILWGEKDAWQDVAWAHRMHEAIPGSSLEVIEGGGHFVMENDPDLIADRIIAFTDAHPG
ncbi:alpha/beta fold hydrolase [Amorphus orientalis]|uniref:Pimeloyl-ACP methyl ester carboxylesterase n=1 Tax=Amorphus orientalis TaxID=649198 RepID=A0AAE3VQ80_9HYPH|nr:alpha/beta hydrolase [Amorphus orientalis]MDQ0316141.1 pimeloyl-ACP methyl ester carboxylesterase [Amorphus orientalis]